MWQSGVTRRKRHLALAEMIESAVRTGVFKEPWRCTPQVFDFFRTEADILQELQGDWRTAFAGAVYVAIDKGQGDLQQDVMAAFATVSARYAGVRKVLEAHADHPAISAGMRKERALLSTFALLVNDETTDAVVAAATVAAAGRAA